MVLLNSQTVNPTDFLNIIENAKTGYLIIDANKIIQYLNKSASKMLNQKAETLLGKHFQTPLGNALPSTIKIYLLNKKIGVAKLSQSSIVWQNREAVLLTIDDISKQVANNKFRDELIGNVSHELRTPLTIIRESISQVQDGILGAINSEQKKFLEMGLRHVDRLRNIVNELLDLSKLEAGKIELHKTKTNMSKIVQSAWDAFIPLIEKQGLESRLFIPEKPVFVYADSERVVQVLNNLIGNALKFTNKGHISIRMAGAGETLSCTVEDTGCGIAREDIPKIFNKFQQFDTRADQTIKGTGLGLAIAKEIIEQHLGNLRADSEINKGTQFTFNLPLYTPFTVLHDRFQHRTKKSSKPFIMYSVNCDNFKKIKSLVGDSFIESSLNHLKYSLSALPYTIESVMPEDSDTFYFLEDRHPDDVIPNPQLFRLIKQAFFKIDMDFELDLSYRTALFPQNGTTLKELLDASRDTLKSEVLERFEKQILCVDDMPELTEELKTLLEDFGYRNIDTVNSGEAALKYMNETLPDLITLDMMMPGMSGYEVIGRLKESHRTKDIPVLIVSGYDVETGQFNEYIKEKAIITISKPAKPNLLRKMVYYLL